MPTGKIGIIISVTNPVIELPPQDRDTVTSFLEADFLPLGYRTRLPVCTTMVYPLVMCLHKKPIPTSATVKGSV